MNVAITRAKHCLFIFGNAQTLCRDKNWNDLIQFCKDRHAQVPERRSFQRIGKAEQEIMDSTQLHDPLPEPENSKQLYSKLFGDDNDFKEQKQRLHREKSKNHHQQSKSSKQHSKIDEGSNSGSKHVKKKTLNVSAQLNLKSKGSSGDHGSMRKHDRGKYRPVYDRNCEIPPGQKNHNSVSPAKVTSSNPTKEITEKCQSKEKNNDREREL